MRGQAPEGTKSTGFWGRFGRAVAALVSLGLVIGLGLWVWRLGTQDVTQVPVVLAQSGPMRVEPEEPGGTQVPHQGLEVNDVVAGVDAPLLPDEVTLAPAPLEPEGRPPEVEVVEEGTEEVEEEPEVVDTGSRLAPTTSVVPRARPTDLSTVLTAPEPEQPVEIEDSAIPQGSHMIQLGAFDSEQVALLQWAGLADSQPDLLAGKQRYIEQTSSGGRILFRLRAVGYSSATETRAACAALTARGLQCIPVVK
ncbi:Sporulation related domain-containing protein [Monaibacterium marinum]|uniref:Sporulation related domain-containing protein n=1 Tax=Pontivivens marinum TaxID=1690039 RepID=A0A2C9CPU6_9RHOB|nr:SPOR domain-containing protein [Monaibacterium marinum]SOH92379.1 Sporulation related domain-containing protein [Monaibacterium marinum]